MANPYRRVTKAEDPIAWASRRYTRASPGKFRKSSKTISYWSFRTEQFTKAFPQFIDNIVKKVTPKIFYKKQRETRSSVTSHKGYITRARHIELKEYMDKLESLYVDVEKETLRDAKIIEKFLKSGWNSLTYKERIEFKHLFVRYPKDEIRRWLGSNEESIRARTQFGGVRKAA